jgi:hypothetical protein
VALDRGKAAAALVSRAATPPRLDGHGGCRERSQALCRREEAPWITLIGRCMGCDESLLPPAGAAIDASLAAIDASLDSVRRPPRGSFVCSTQLHPLLHRAHQSSRANRPSSDSCFIESRSVIRNSYLEAHLKALHTSHAAPHQRMLVAAPQSAPMRTPSSRRRTRCLIRKSDAASEVRGAAERAAQHAEHGECAAEGAHELPCAFDLRRV